MSDVKRLNFTVSQFESVVPYASEHGQYVRFADYAKLEAEAQALRDEVAALRARVVVVPEPDENGTSEAVEYRASNYYADGWNDCLDELARLNGKVVNEGLLRRALAYIETMTYGGTDGLELIAELRALLGEGKEHE